MAWVHLYGGLLISLQTFNGAPVDQCDGSLGYFNEYGSPTPYHNMLTLRYIAERGIHEGNTFGMVITKVHR